MLHDDVLIYILNGKPHPLAAPLAEWLSTSRRFAAFADTFRDKIRKKLRAPHDEASLLDLRLELETAFLLLHERALSLVYEPQQPGGARAPDFAVAFTTSITFMAEVTRLRAAAETSAAPPPERLARKPFLVVHGVRDTVLPIQNGRASRAILERLPVDLTYKEYPMAHEVSSESLQDVTNWLSARLDEGAS
ncbi:hypothetical protein SE17_35215 [Kouleothrix aurantiaca]|uniref:Phospholipase/carboxylesterase/thioesterase domain-containing protein n=1 Tax=Kouleothrix aurantiaca TaxID=186479 RepID=A0A0P9D0K8_9CHLR|nr:hypothetical protein SE17_35215 [Kouleothrix aurantiaca]